MMTDRVWIIFIELRGGLNGRTIIKALGGITKAIQGVIRESKGKI
jgi:hypothetical protein